MRPGSSRRLAIVSRSVSVPPRDGYARRVIGLATEFARDATVTLVMPEVREGPEPRASLDAIGVAIATYPQPRRPRSLRGRVAGLLDLTPRYARGLSRRALTDALARLAADGLDLVQVEANEFVEPARAVGVPVVLDAHNVWSLLERRRVRTEPWSPRSILSALEFVKTRRAERAAWALADAILATSADEAQRIAAVTDRPVEVIPNGVDADAFAPAAGPRLQGEICFVGLLSYGPNADGLRWFVRAILPRIVERYPDVVFTVVGRDAPADVRGLASDRIRLTGEVEDVRTWLGRAAALVVPLRYGAGTRLKILEALALGTPVITTRVGAEGLDLRDGVDVLVRDGADAFADAVIATLTDRASSARRAVAGRARVERDFDWRVIGRRARVVHDRVLDSFAARGSDAPLGTP